MLLKSFQEQKPLFPALTEERLKKIFENVLQNKVHLILTENRSSLFSAYKKGGVYNIRLAKFFLDASERVIEDLAFFILKRCKLSENVKSFIKTIKFPKRDKKRKKTIINYEGTYFNLYEIYQKLNQLYFDNQLNVAITWGKMSKRGFVKKRQLGNYSENDHLIRINPILDNKHIPSYYVEFIVYHEMLHALLGVKKINGRRAIHTKEFRKLEKQFYFYEKAVAWEKSGRL